ncbi:MULTISPECIES: hypothetical protein [Flavobacteriaceae]|nr:MULTISPECIES: hypothetical protein [Flavobacteriaceae]
MNNQEEEEYSGIWMKVGCFLSSLALIGILVLIGLGVYLLISGA